MRYITSGGQSTLHKIRMSIQVMRFAFKLSLFFMPLILIILAYTFLESQDWGVVLQYAKAFLFTEVINQPFKITSFHHMGNSVTLSYQAIYENKMVKNTVVDFYHHIQILALFSLVIAILLFFAIQGWFFARGKKLFSSHIVSGDDLLNLKAYNRLVGALSKKEAVQPYHLSGALFPPYTETLHTLLLGATGTGKTQTICTLIEQIRSRGDRAIIYDKMGTYIHYFYDPQKDVIMNPLDQRSPSWNIFKEVHHKAEFESIALALIPEAKNSNDPFWMNAARTLLVEYCNQRSLSSHAKTRDIIDDLLKKDLSSISGLLSDTAANSIVDEQSPKTALSVMAILSTYVKSLGYLQEGGEEFSMKDWIQDDQKDGLIFISSSGQYHHSLKPLISAWIEIAINNMLSLQQSRRRKIWMIIDELPSLHSLPSLHDGLAQSRQYGGAFVLSAQLYSQMVSAFGRENADTTCGLCRTRMFFSVPDHETAKWCAENIGKVEREERAQGISYGASQVRDGVSISSHKKETYLVNPTVISKMKNLETYIQFPSQVPLTHFHFKFTPRKPVAKRYQFQKFTQSYNVDEGTNALAEYEKAPVNNSLLSEEYENSVLDL